MAESVYIHVPFCQNICAYCDFTRCKYFEPLANKWFLQIKKDILQLPKKSMKTIYIGGGTPTCLSEPLFYELLKILSVYCSQRTEFTMEANAESLSIEKINIMKAFGVNRISLGAQTFQPKLLKLIQRDADYNCIKQAITNLHTKGIHNISLDLMYGLPQQTFTMFQEDLKKIIDLDIQHISLYSLTIEEHSLFGRMNIASCSQDFESDCYEYAIAFLNAHGFQQYEISSFAKHNAYSKHNLVYWNYEDFYGIGCGASGKLENYRYDNTRNLHTYIENKKSYNVIQLSKQDQMFERIMMGLRLNRGISLEDFKTRFSTDLLIEYQTAIQKHVQLNNLVIANGYLSTTYQGMLGLHTILEDFIE